VFSESKFNVQGRALNVARGPVAGPPLLLLHGVTRRWQDFSPVLAELSARWEVFALDFRGHGKSDRATDYRVIDYAADAVAVLQNVVGAPAIVYGHSLGAMAGAAVGAQLPR
jgi:pimeloyl-ACP methyl ester carboxylesterase